MINNFINSVKQTAPDLAAAALYDLQVKREMNVQLPTFMEILDLFRGIIAFRQDSASQAQVPKSLSTPQKPNRQIGDFASQVQNPGSPSTPRKSNRQIRKAPPRQCVCGSMHWYSQCFYINESRRPKGWNRQFGTITDIDDTLRLISITAWDGTPRLCYFGEDDDLLELQRHYQNDNPKPKVVKEIFEALLDPKVIPNIDKAREKNSHG